MEQQESKSLLNTEIAYLAGFFDGEGCIEIKKWNPPKSSTRNIVYGLQISATQVDPAPLEKFYQYFGGVLILKERVGPNQRRVHKWTVKSIQAKNALELLLPYLIVKKDQALLALEFQENMHPERTGWHGKLTLEELQNRDRIRNSIRELKKVVYA